MAHGNTDESKDYSYLKIREFPAPNRGSPPTIAEFKGYLKKYKTEPLNRKFADFNLLLFIAELIDVPTAVNLAKSVICGIPLDKEIYEWFETF